MGRLFAASVAWFGGIPQLLLSYLTCVARFDRETHRSSSHFQGAYKVCFLHLFSGIKSLNCRDSPRTRKPNSVVSCCFLCFSACPSPWSSKVDLFSAILLLGRPADGVENVRRALVAVAQRQSRGISLLHRSGMCVGHGECGVRVMNNGVVGESSFDVAFVVVISNVTRLATMQTRRLPLQPFRVDQSHSRLEIFVRNS